MIRIGNEKDLDKINKLNLLIFSDKPEELEEDFYKKIKMNSYYLSVFEEKNELLGYMAGYEKDGNYYIWMSGVYPDKTGRGIGKNLLNHQLEYAKNKFSKVTIKTSTKWKFMLLLLIKNDFIITGFKKDEFPFPAIYLEKVLGC